MFRDILWYHSSEVNLNPVWIFNYIHNKVWDEITYPFPIFNGAFTFFVHSYTSSSISFNLRKASVWPPLL